MPPRLDPRRWPLSWRLTAFFALATSAIVFGVMWAMYGQLRGQLHEKDELELRNTVQVQLAIAKELDTGRPAGVWQQEWTEQAMRDDRLLLRVIGPDGGVYSSSPRLAVPEAEFPAASARRRFKRFQAGGQDGHTAPVNFLLTARSREVRPGRVWTVQAALDTSDSDHLLRIYRDRLILLLCAAILASCALGWALVRRGLSPLRAMSRSIARIDSGRLHARIADQAWPLDLLELAQSFDDMLRRLEVAFEQLSRFSSDLAHEFRSPITNLVAAASVMLRRDRTIADYQETLAVVVDEGERLSRMVSSMLFLARADHAQQALKPETLSAAAELGKLRDAFEAIAEDQGVRLLVVGDAALVADPMLLRRALHNLVVNALAHTPRGGTITLSAKPVGRGAELAVSDDGAGIAAQHLPHLFDRFYRVDAARSSSENSGLGLAIVKSIVELHGGSVAVASQPGMGVTFTLGIPAVAAPQAAGAAT